MPGFAHFLGLNYGMHRAKQAEQQSNPLKGFNGGIEESLVNSEKAANEQIAANSGGIEESLVESGDTAIGQQPRPKYRLPNDEEAKQKLADYKFFGKLGSSAVGLGLGPIGAATAEVAADLGLTKYEPSLEKWIRNSPTIPAYENWEENDYWEAYQGT